MKLRRFLPLLLMLFWVGLFTPQVVLPESIEQLFQQGNAALEKERYTEAEAVWSRLIKLEPNNAIFYFKLGDALDKQGKLDEAIPQYRQAIVLDPKFASAYSALGFALYNQGKLDEAITQYRQAIVLNSKLIYPYINLGLALIDQNQLDEAIIQFRQALKLDPNNHHTYSALGFALYSQGKLDEAITQYRQAIALNPKGIYTYINMGLALVAQNKLDEAIIAYQKALSLPENRSLTRTTAHTLAHNGLGLVYQKQGKLKEALQQFEAALEIDPSYEFAKNNRDAVLALLKHPLELAYTDTRYLRPDDPLARPKRAVVLLTPIFSSQGRYKDGTGFIIKRAGNKLWIITNRHIVVDSYYSTPPRTSDSVEVKLYLGDKPSNASIKIIKGLVIHTAEDPDLAIIELEAPNLPPDIQPLPIATPSNGMKITTIGHPSGDLWKDDQGTVIDNTDQELTLKISLAVGSSGSPIMESNNGIVGIIYKIDQKGIGFAIAINQVVKQAEAWGVKLP